MNKTEYKSSKITKKKIASAYLTVLNDKDQPSVMDIVRTAGLNRGTFYLHFKNLTDVERFIDDELVSNFKCLEDECRQFDLDQFPERFLTRFNAIVSKEMEYYKLFINLNRSSEIMAKIKKVVMNSVDNNFKMMKYITNFDRFLLAVEFAVSGCLQCYFDWFKGNSNMDLQTLTIELSSLIRDGLKGYIKQQ